MYICICIYIYIYIYIYIHIIYPYSWWRIHPPNPVVGPQTPEPSSRPPGPSHPIVPRTAKSSARHRTDVESPDEPKPTETVEVERARENRSSEKRAGKIPCVYIYNMLWLNIYIYGI